MVEAEKQYSQNVLLGAQGHTNMSKMSIKTEPLLSHGTATVSGESKGKKRQLSLYFRDGRCQKSERFASRGRKRGPNLSSVHLTGEETMKQKKRNIYS